MIVDTVGLYPFELFIIFQSRQTNSKRNMGILS